MEFLPRVDRAFMPPSAHQFSGVSFASVVFFFGAAFAVAVAFSSTALVSRKRAEGRAQGQLRRLVEEIVQLGVCARAWTVAQTSVHNVGGLVSGFLGRWFCQQLTHPPRVLLLGLDNAGKTSLCHVLGQSRCRGWPSRQPRPEHHVLHHEGEWQGQVFHLIDPSGDELRQKDHRLALWGQLLKSRPDVVIFVVDASDTSRHAVAREALHWVLGHPVVKELPVLVLGNKIDLPRAVDTWSLQCRLGLAGFSREQRDALLGLTKSAHGMPFELRHRIAGFMSHSPPPPDHRGPLAIKMCSLSKRQSLNAALRWLGDNLHATDSSNRKVYRKCWAPCATDVCALFARCLGGRTYGEFSRQAALLPLFQA